MISFHNINTVAKYETKTLLRSWFFRIFAILVMVILFFFNFAVLVQSNGGAGDWELKALPSLIPYVNLFMLNAVQAIIAIFLASDFLKRDKKLDTTEVIYMRSMSNGEYVMGKTLGNLLVFLVFNMVILLIALVFNLTVSNLSVSWISYFNYFFLISVPTLVFIMGLSFLLMSVLKNQAITFVILLGYVALTLFYLQNKFYYVFDYMAFRIPLTYSDFVGFGNLSTILIHRGIYFFMGLSFILLTISFLKRLPQVKHFRHFSVVLSSVFFFFSIYLGYLHVSAVIKNNNSRAMMLEINDTYAGEKAPLVKSYQIDLKHEGASIQVTSRLSVGSSPHGEKPQKLFFSLNPGLQLEKVQVDGTDAEYTRKQHLIELKKELAAGASATIEFTYKGTIDEAACYLDVDDEKRMESYSQMMCQIDKRYAFVTPDYVLLTREDLWYPVPGATYSTKNKQWFSRQFSDFKLNVETRPDLVAISQGTCNQDANQFHFENKHALSQISLVIGHYQKTSAEIDGLQFNLYVKDGHDYFSESLAEIKDTIPSLIAEALQDYERKVDMYYPFESFSLVEVPVQFYSYDHIYSGEREPMQPEMVLFVEKGLTVREADFNGSLQSTRRFRVDGVADLTPAEKKIQAIQRFLACFTEEKGRPGFSRSGGNVTVTETVNPYYVFPMFYNQAYYINSDKWPVTNRIFESYLKLSTSGSQPGFMRNIQGTSEDEQGNIALLEHSFAELLNDPNRTDIIDNIIKLKGEALFSIIKRKTGDDAFDNFMFDYLNAHQFKTASVQDFNDQIKAKFKVDLLPYMETWFNSTQLPAYLIGAVNAVEVLDKDALKTMVKFKVTNAEPVEGIVSVEFMTGGGGFGPGSMRGDRSMETIKRLVHLDGNQTKQVSLLLDGQPRRITINTLTSKNIPNELSFPLDNIKEDKKAVPYEGEEIVDVPVRIAEDNEIIVDNEDAGFSVVQTDETSLLKRLLLDNEETKDKYAGLNLWRPPYNWTLTTNSDYYGKFIRSADYIRSGKGDKKAIWKVPIKEGGNYVVYAYINKQGSRGRGRGRSDASGEYEFTVHHDDGDEKTAVDLKSAEDGWNELGAFYFSPDTAVVELSNQSESRIVIADAVKLVLQ